MSLHIRPLSYSLGAEIVGVDLSRPVDDESFGKIHTAFLERGVLLFREQPLTQEQFVKFSMRFGEVDTNDAGGYSNEKRSSEYPQILVHRSKPATNPSDPATIHLLPIQGGYWHTDRVHMLSPVMATLLRSIEVPKVGGDTMFANMSLGYEALSDGMKNLIGALYCVHPAAMHDFKQSDPAVAQPLVRVHPETARKALYLTEKVKQFAGMTEEESKPLIQFLCKHAARPQFCYRHQWRKDDLIMWDNRCMWHYAVGDFDRAQVRHMERTTVFGTPSGGYVYDGHPR